MFFIESSLRDIRKNNDENYFITVHLNLIAKK